MLGFRDAYEDIRHVAAGRAVNGRTPLPTRVRFPEAPSVLQAAAGLLHVLYTFVGAVEPLRIHQAATRTALGVKLLSHLVGTGRVTPEAIAGAVLDVTFVADMLAEQPRLISVPVSFGVLLARERRCLTACPPDAVVPPSLPGDVPPPPRLWSSYDGAYRLLELIEPGHFVLVGTRQGAVYSPELPLWRGVAEGVMRVFCFGDAQGGLSMLVVGMADRCLLEVAPLRYPVFTGQEPCYPALVDAVRHLQDVLGPLRFHEEPRLFNQPPPPPAAGIEAWVAWFLARRLHRRRFPPPGN